MNDLRCSEHSGHCAQLDSLEDNVSKLWTKWDSMQKLVIGTMVSATLSFIGVVILLLTKLTTSP